MSMRNKFFQIMMVALIPLMLTACSSNKNLGDSDGMTMGGPDAGQGTSVDGSGEYGRASVGGVESSAVPGTQADLAVQAGSDIIYFDTNSQDLNAQGRNVVEGQARWLNMYPNLNVSIEGHADERGTREYNLALGDRRASSVKNYMIAMGVDPRRVNTISYGKEQPVIIGMDGTSWAQNRRARTRVE